MRPVTAMPQPDDVGPDHLGRDDTRLEALERLDGALKTFEARRAGPAPGSGRSTSAEDGYRLMAGLVGGLFGGVGLGWTFDRFVHTSPLGLVAGLVIGVGLSTYSVVHSAGRMNASSGTTTGATPAVPDDKDDD